MDRKRSVRRHRRYEKPFAKKCRELCRQFIAFMFSNVGIIGLVVSYTIGGAFMFSWVETQTYPKLSREVIQYRTVTVERIWNLTIEHNPFVEDVYKRQIVDELVIYQNRMIDFIHRGYDGSANDTNTSNGWSLSSGFLYSLTVITTIGYGNIAPLTERGKILTIVYAIIGMPLFLLYLSNIGDIMARSFKWIYANLCLCRWCPGVARRRAERRQRRRAEQQNYHNDYDDGEDDDTAASTTRWHQQQQQMDDNSRHNYYGHQRNSVVSENISEGITDDDAVTDDDEDDESYDVQTVTVPITICLAIMVGYVCGGALIFQKWEQWDFVDASYFCFISLSTIGFGDLVPGDNIYSSTNELGVFLELSLIFCSMYLMLGMALIAMCFSLMQEEVIHKIQNFVRTIKYILHCNR